MGDRAVYGRFSKQIERQELPSPRDLYALDNKHNCDIISFAINNHKGAKKTDCPFLLSVLIMQSISLSFFEKENFSPFTFPFVPDAAAGGFFCLPIKK